MDRTFTSLNHLSALDGLRALAILLVLFRHGAIFFLRELGYETVPEGAYILRFFANGWVGVDLFFVLSGFLISRAFFSGHRPPVTLYLWKRALRIVPAYYAVLLLCVLETFPYYDVPRESLTVQIVTHMVFLQDYFPSNINVVFWSLGVEEKFYLLAPFVLMGILKLYQKGRLVLPLALFAALVVSGICARSLSYFLAGSPKEYYDFFIAARSPFHACLEPLVIGMMIAFAERVARDKKSDTFQQSAAFIFTAGAIALAMLMLSSEFMRDISWYDATLQPFLIAVFMGAMVLGAVFGGAPRILSARPLRFIAKISYSWYLVHLPLWPLSFVLFKSISANADTLQALPLFLVLFFILSGLTAYALYALVERPFLKIKDGLTKNTPSSS